MRKDFFEICLHDKCYIIKENEIIAEISEKGKITKIKFINYKNPIGTVKRYYISRDGYIIGWISHDLLKCKGKTIKQQNYLNDILSVMKGMDSITNESIYN